MQAAGAAIQSYANYWHAQDAFRDMLHIASSYPADGAYNMMEDISVVEQAPSEQLQLF